MPDKDPRATNCSWQKYMHILLIATYRTYEYLPAWPGSVLGGFFIEKKMYAHKSAGEEDSAFALRYAERANRDLPTYSTWPVLSKGGRSACKYAIGNHTRCYASHTYVESTLHG